MKGAYDSLVNRITMVI